MKKITLVIILMAMIFFPSAYAASIGDAETQGQGKFSIGLDQEYMFKRDLEYKSGFDLDPGDDIKNVEVKKLYRTMLKGSLGLLPWLDAYVRLGVADDKFEGEATFGGVTLAEFDGKTKMAFAYGGGLKAAFPVGNGFLIGADLQYLRYKNKIKGDFADVFGLGLTESFDGKATFQEWHIAPYVACKMQNVTPYLGLRYSDLSIKAKFDFETGDSATGKFKADDNIGLFGGFSYAFTPNLKLNLEGRFIDETALNIGLSYKF